MQRPSGVELIYRTGHGAHSELVERRVHSLYMHTSGCLDGVRYHDPPNTEYIEIQRGLFTAFDVGHSCERYSPCMATVVEGEMLLECPMCERLSLCHDRTVTISQDLLFR